LEKEWIIAAGGKENGRFPFDKYDQKHRTKNEIMNRANFRSLYEKTPVYLFPLGISYPHKIMDFSGNVFEWMQNYFDKSESTICKKGGCFASEIWEGKVITKRQERPEYGSNVIGFRLILFTG